MDLGSEGGCITSQGGKDDFYSPEKMGCTYLECACPFSQAGCANISSTPPDLGDAAKGAQVRGPLSLHLNIVNISEEVARTSIPEQNSAM